MGYNLIFVSGPKFAGKDTVGQVLKKNYPNVEIVRFKHVLYQALAFIYNLPYETVDEICNDRKIKETPIDEFDGRSPREALIYASDLLRKGYGDAWVAERLFKEFIETFNPFKTYVFTDCGFNSEVNRFIRLCQLHIPNFNESSYWKVWLNREGCGFNDDREVMNSPDIVINNPCPLYPVGPTYALMLEYENIILKQIGVWIN